MLNHTSLLLVVTAVTAIAQTAPATLRVSSETAPPGGMAQMKLLLTSPKPIPSGALAMDLSGVTFDSIDGIALFSSTGDVSGAAVVNGGRIYVQFVSPNGTFGTNTDYPLLTVALTLSKAAFPGQIFPVNLNQAATALQNLLGPIRYEVKPGSITVGGSISITNVVPGGGILNAGDTFSILGMNFSPSTKMVVRGVSTSAIDYVSASEFRVTLSAPGSLDGVCIRAENPDKSSDTYYSYMRGAPVGQSARPLLARTVPVFSTLAATEAVMPATISPLVNPDYFTAIALQNPSRNPALITIESHSALGALTGATRITLNPGTRITREVSELFGAVLPTGSYVGIISTEAVQMLGLLGNDRTGVVLPIAFHLLSAAAAPPPATASVSGATADDGGGSRNQPPL